MKKLLKVQISKEILQKKDKKVNFFIYIIINFI
jgi:hypothetical protein